MTTTLHFHRSAPWGAAAMLVAALAAAPAQANDVRLDHEGDGRCFDISQSGGGSTDVLSRGNGGCLNADVRGRTSIFMLGDGVRGHVDGPNGGDLSIYMGMCPPGMTLEPVDNVAGPSGGLRIPRCI